MKDVYALLPEKAASPNSLKKMCGNHCIKTYTAWTARAFLRNGKRNFTVLLMIALCCAAKAQENPNVKALEITSNPGYVLLGVQPTNISRPSTPRDFVAGMQSAVVNGRLQPNFAMEANPFNWFKKQSKEKDYRFIADDYLSPKAGPAIRRNFAISLATSESDTIVFGDLQKGMGLGYGLRFTIFPGTVNKATLRNVTDISVKDVKIVFLEALQFLIDDNDDFKYEYLSRAQDLAIAHLHKRKDIPEHLKPLVEKEIAQYRAAFALKTEQAEALAFIHTEDSVLQRQIADAASGIGMRKEPFARDGFILEFAYSGVTVFQQNQWAQAVNARNGIWLTPSYRIDLGAEDQPDLIQSFDVLGVVRYLWNDKKVDTGNYLDLGLKAQFNRNDWNVSLEGVARHASTVPADVKSNWTYSWLTTFSYTINEITTLKFTFGSRFNGHTTTYTQPAEMIAVGGLSFGLFK
ncbi:hypothetical protein [Chitinophaga cymbidii]|uniref:Uncharacterized protein n=1 Tax=Chitinophaga cymbidii TaxID=1096750 RepID=A0A512RQC2_9BACT|nr:hypothetical protein [Chitinophaga cymbidii]GEP97885.1 hypothetical protein CCY01nite_41450 [Chitinophaga cymbidii]